MKHLTTTLCLTIAVLLGSLGVSWGATYPIVGYEINVIYIYIITICILVIVGIFVTRFYIQKRAANFAKNQMRRCLVVWAVQGPFDNGAESMKAYRQAICLIFGEDESQKYLDAIRGHADSYDLKSDEWENTRSSALDLSKVDLIDLELGRQLLCTTELENFTKSLMDPNYLERGKKKLEAVDILINYRSDLDAYEKHLSNEGN